MSITIKQNILTKNDCYKSGRTRTAVGMQLHTIGTAQNTASALASYWNQSGIQACVHYCIDAETPGLVYQFLPDNRRAWADAGFGNSSLIAVELMESDYMKYTGGANYTITNEAKFKADVTRAYNTAVEFFAQKCKQYGWNPQEKMSNGLYRVSSHDEGRRLGLSSGHVDPTHIWNRYGWTMDQFRADVAKAMGGVVVQKTTEEPRWYRVRKTWADASSQLGAYQVLQNAKDNCPYGYAVFDENGKEVYRPSAPNYKTLQAKDLNGMSEAQKIATVAPIYQEVMKETGMLASVGLAQFCLESGYGTTDLAQNANNMHGMKCSLSGNTWANSVWDGKSRYGKKSPEVYNGVTQLVYSEFRKYPAIYKSVQDRAAYFIGAWLDAAKTKHRYPNVNMIKDAETQVRLLKKGGYATDPNYVSKLLNIINRFNLTQYDNGITPSVWNTSSDANKGTQKPSSVTPTQSTTPSPTTPKTTFYRVQTGVFTTTSKRDKLIKNIKNKLGFDCFYEKIGNNYYVYCGSFKDRNIAVQRVTQLKSKGFDAFIKAVT